ncbi:hypothetical protein LTS14_007743 [Recurvomyces mirabilis]|nr:hypothetical protein LTS14_007743 [Recurvomyces mirabilis]
MAFGTAWKRLSPRQLNFAIQAFSLIAIFFEGYDQGVMGGVNASPRYVQEVAIGTPAGVVTNDVKQGGIVSIYYLGAIVGCFVGGWAADRIGRINGLFYAAFFALIGGALQAATQSADFILIARVVTGLGTGVLTGITPVMISEVSSATHRGGYLGYVFIADYLGISIAYWLSFGLAFVDNGYSDVRWNFFWAFNFVLLRQAGYSALKQNGLAGGLNAIGIVGTIISAQIVDKLGRRPCLMGGAGGLAVVNLIAASLYEAARHNRSISTQVAPAAVTMLFLFNLVYAATWGTVAFLVPTEIFPSDLRAQGNGFGITGWAIGVGWAVLVNPIMFGHLENRTYFLFAGLNLLWIPIVYLLYPETKDRSLESIDAMFSSSSPFFNQMERSYELNKDVVALAGGERAKSVASVEKGHEPGTYK